MSLPQMIYVARNIKDNAVSYFHFSRMNKGMPEVGPWEQFLQSFIAGKGEWIMHLELRPGKGHSLRTTAQAKGEPSPLPSPSCYEKVIGVYQFSPRLRAQS